MAQVSRNPSFYELLGVPPTATPDEVRSAYRRLSRQLHPDAGGNGALFQLLVRAYETLSDPTRRAEYDVSLGAAEPELRPVQVRRQGGGQADGLRRAAGVSRRATEAGRPILAGAVLGATWYLIRATGLLALVMGTSAASHVMPAGVESWARPASLGRLILCVTLGAVAASWHPLMRVRVGVLGSRWWIRGAIVGVLAASVLLGEYLLTIQGRRWVVVGAVAGVVASGAFSRARRSRIA